MWSKGTPSLTHINTPLAYAEKVVAYIRPLHLLRSPTQILFTGLENNHSRSLDLTNHPRFQNRLLRTPNSNRGAENSITDKRPTENSPGGSFLYAIERDNYRSAVGIQDIYKQHLSHTEKGQRMEACYKPKRTEQISSLQTLQDGRYPSLEGYTFRERLVHQTRPKRCLIHHPHGKTTPTLPPIYLEQPLIPISCSSLRLIICPLVFHQSNEVCRIIP